MTVTHPDDRPGDAIPQDLLDAIVRVAGGTPALSPASPRCHLPPHGGSRRPSRLPGSPRLEGALDLGSRRGPSPPSRAPRPTRPLPLERRLDELRHRLKDGLFQFAIVAVQLLGTPRGGEFRHESVAGEGGSAEEEPLVQVPCASRLTPHPGQAALKLPVRGEPGISPGVVGGKWVVMRYGRLT